MMIESCFFHAISFSSHSNKICFISFNFILFPFSINSFYKDEESMGEKKIIGNHHHAHQHGPFHRYGRKGSFFKYHYIEQKTLWVVRRRNCRFISNEYEWLHRHFNKLFNWKKLKLYKNIIYKIILHSHMLCVYTNGILSNRREKENRS